MPLPFFEHAYLLQSLGWAIANSIWQVGSLWLFYQFIIMIDKKIPAMVKHHLSTSLLLVSFILFINTFVQTYRLIINDTSSTQLALTVGWAPGWQSLKNLFPYLSLVYLVLISFYAVQFIKNLSRNRFLQRKGLTKPSISIRLFTINTALHLGIKTKIQVWLSEHVDVPSVTGFIKPVILLPVAIMNHLSVAQIEAILLHELAHIRRNDYLVNLLQSIVVLILFFNPFAVLLSKAAKKERENCCDDWVLNFQYNQYEYASALLILEEQRHHVQYRFALSATNGKKNLLNRVKRLFHDHPQVVFGSVQKIKLICIFLFVIIGIFSALPQMMNNQGHHSVRTGLTNKKEEIAGVNLKKLSHEKSLNNILTIKPLESTNQKSQLPAKDNSTKERLSEPERNYVNAFINEELITNEITPTEPIFTRTAATEIDNTKYLIIIEEEESGKKPTMTYYFELKNKNGNSVLKPLIILNNISIGSKKTIKPTTKNLTDSLANSSKHSYKRRITS